MFTYCIDCKNHRSQKSAARLSLLDITWKLHSGNLSNMTAETKTGQFQHQRRVQFGCEKSQGGPIDEVLHAIMTPERGRISPNQ